MFIRDGYQMKPIDCQLETVHYDVVATMAESSNNSLYPGFKKKKHFKISAVITWQ